MKERTEKETEAKREGENIRTEKNEKREKDRTRD
jgi:hypothetical protein